MLGATLYLVKDITVVLDSASSLQFVSYGVVFILSTFFIYKQKIATQWIVLGTMLLGVVLTYIA